jgi:hypothetical protein
VSLEKVQSGDPLKIPAGTFNTFIDAAQDFQQRQRSQQQRPRSSFTDHGTVLVRNDSGAGRERFDVLGISGVVIDPADNQDEFANHPAVVGIAPSPDTHAAAFVVLLEPVPAGGIATSVAQGVVPVRVDVQDESDSYAGPAEAQCGHLLSGSEGAAAILWKAPGTGVVWALVKVGILASGAASMVARVDASQGGAKYDVIEQTVGTGGDFEDKPDATTFTASNLAEISTGPGGAVDDDTLVLVTTISGDGGTRSVFSHAAYAKYLD